MIDYIEPGELLFQQGIHPELSTVFAVEVADSGKVWVKRIGKNYRLVPQTHLLVECPVCDGNGRLYNDLHLIDCPGCNGDGHVSLHDLSPEIPYTFTVGGVIRPERGIQHTINKPCDLAWALEHFKHKFDHIDIKEEAFLAKSDREVDEGR